MGPGWRQGRAGQVDGRHGDRLATRFCVPGRERCVSLIVQLRSVSFPIVSLTDRTDGTETNRQNTKDSRESRITQDLKDRHTESSSHLMFSCESFVLNGHESSYTNRADNYTDASLNPESSSEMSPCVLRTRLRSSQPQRPMASDIHPSTNPSHPNPPHPTPAVSSTNPRPSLHLRCRSIPIIPVIDFPLLRLLDDHPIRPRTGMRARILSSLRITGRGDGGFDFELVRPQARLRGTDRQIVGGGRFL